MAKDLQPRIEDVDRLAPGEILRIEKQISPRSEVLALIKHFEDRGQGLGVVPAERQARRP